MEYYRCENPDCGYIAQEEPDTCPLCGGTFFAPLLEEELGGADWVNLGNPACLLYTSTSPRDRG